MKRIENIRKKLTAELPYIQQKTDALSLQNFGKDALSYLSSNPACIVFPKTTEEVQELVLFANKNNFPLVPSGGRTGLSGAATATQEEIVVSFDRMNTILHFEAVENTVDVQAGVIIDALQAFAESKNRYYPVAYAATGTSQIGGNIATNAGGIHVIRYGLTRNWVKGLKVVTGKGDILDLNKGLTKNATGYDLRHLFIGSEGTLGMITEATIQLIPKPATPTTFLFACNSTEAFLPLLSWLQSRVQLFAFECFADSALDFALEESNVQFALNKRYPVYALIEFDQFLDPTFSITKENSQQELLEQLFETDLILEAAIAWDNSDRKNLWAHREMIPVSLNKYQPFKNDVAVRMHQVPQFLNDLEHLSKNNSEIQIVWFGHLGDGNIHINFPNKKAVPAVEFQNQCARLMQQIYQLIQSYGGSISAEHGIGLVKKPYLHYSKSESEIGYFKALKKAFDPNNILNPGKIIDL